MQTPTLLASCFSVAFLASAAEPTTTTTERARRGPVLSPEIAADRQVTLRTQAPDAVEVHVSGQWASGTTPLLKDDDGIWSVTIGPIEPGVYEYSFQVDGLRMIDPGNPDIKPMRQPRTSILHIPGNPPLIHDFQNVPHGVVHLHSYRSTSLDRIRQLAVYTPPGYDQHPELRYPVLVLQHGSGDNQATWTVHGKAHWILDNLLAQGAAKPMIMVMLDGHAQTQGAGNSGFTSNTEAFAADLLQDVLPLVDQQYRTNPTREHRGIVGLSMGGGQSLTIGLNHLDQFAWIGGFSSSAPSDEAIASALKDPPTTKARLKLLWIACGKADFLLDRNEKLVALLTEKGIPHQWRLTEGDHSWPVWRTYLAEFLPLVFQP